MKIKNPFKNDNKMSVETNNVDESTSSVHDNTLENNDNQNQDVIDLPETGSNSEVVEVSIEDKLTADLVYEKDRYIRLFAEFENYKRRTSKERLELFKTANQEVLLSMLPVMDDFDRAITEISKSEDELLLKGVTLIHEKLQSTLFSKGLEEVSITAGDIFDADFAEAITQIPAPSPNLKGKIVDVIEKGYKLGDKIIRYPKVVIGN